MSATAKRMCAIGEMVVDETSHEDWSNARKGEFKRKRNKKARHVWMRVECLEQEEARKPKVY